MPRGTGRAPGSETSTMLEHFSDCDTGGGGIGLRAEPGVGDGFAARANEQLRRVRKAEPQAVHAGRVARRFQGRVDRLARPIEVSQGDGNRLGRGVPAQRTTVG
ncbi:MAG: hypothetical protein V9G11_07965 [Bifidobacterium adolescentis]